MMQSKAEIERLICEILVDLFEFPPEQVTLDARIVEDLDLDSIDAVDLIAKIQEATGKSIDPARFQEIETIADIVEEACRL